MNGLLDWIVTHEHQPPLEEEEFAAVVSRLGFDIGSQLKSIYSACNGARWMSDSGSQIGILPIEKIERARMAIYGTDADAYGSSSVYTFFFYGDSDYASIDSSRKGQAGEYVVVDCWHESFANDHPPPIIAGSVFDFLSQLRDTNSKMYWLH